MKLFYNQPVFHGPTCFKLDISHLLWPALSQARCETFLLNFVPAVKALLTTSGSAVYYLITWPDLLWVSSFHRIKEKAHWYLNLQAEPFIRYSSPDLNVYSFLLFEVNIRWCPGDFVGRRRLFVGACKDYILHVPLSAGGFALPTPIWYIGCAFRSLGQYLLFRCENQIRSYLQDLNPDFSL